MKSSRPYLARALYEWLLDNELTPYLVVDATQPGVEVPRQFVQNGQIVLNAAPTAVRDLFMENQAIGFSARFGGQPMQVMIPIPALIAIYARENGAGMVFGHEPELDAAEFDDVDLDSGELGSFDEASKPELTVTKPLSEKEGESASAGATKKKKPTLRVVK